MCQILVRQKKCLSIDALKLVQQFTVDAYKIFTRAQLSQWGVYVRHIRVLNRNKWGSAWSQIIEIKAPIISAPDPQNKFGSLGSGSATLVKDSYWTVQLLTYCVQAFLMKRIRI